MHKRLSCLLLIVLAARKGKGDDDQDTYEKFLNNTLHYQTSEAMEKLLKGYDREALPSKGTIDITKLTMTPVFYLLDETSQTMTITIDVIVEWVDEIIKERWQSAGFKASQTAISVWNYQIWIPSQISLDNGVDLKDYQFIEYSHSHATLTSTGRVSLAVREVVKVACHFDFSSFPNDVQPCPVILTVNFASKDVLRLKNSNPQILPYNGATKDDPVPTHINGWQIVQNDEAVAVPVQARHGKSWATQDLLYQTATDYEAFEEVVVFWFKFKRHNPAFKSTYIPPSLGVTACILTVFLLPSRKSQLWVLLLLMLLQALLSRALMTALPPATGGMPGIASYYGFNIVLTTVQLITVVSCMALSMLTSPVPSYIRKVVSIADILSPSTYILPKLNRKTAQFQADGDKTTDDENKADNAESNVQPQDQGSHGGASGASKSDAAENLEPASGPAEWQQAARELEYMIAFGSGALAVLLMFVFLT